MGLTPNRFSQRMARASARIGRWPRRLAALGCLLLAAGSALAPTDTVRGSPSRTAARLGPGEVAVPVPVSAAGAALARVGERVGLVAPHGMLADRLRVLSVHPPGESLSGDDSAVVVVAVRRAQAVLVARWTAARLVLIADDLP